jgi:eukaryotic-like serine/threonine-protein kinase
MATGVLPFQGETSALIFDAILNRASIPVLRLNRNVPPRLNDIIEKALEKNRELRYQTATEMRRDLQRLKRDFESGRSAVSGIAAEAPSAGNGASTISSGPSVAAPVATPPSGSAPAVAASSSGSVPATGAHPVSAPSWKRWQVLVPSAVLLAALLAAPSTSTRGRRST